MSQKDIEIKIKATDQASAKTKKISAALKEINKDFVETQASAKKGGGAIGELANDLGQLSNQSAKIKGFSAISAELGKSAAALKANSDLAREATQSLTDLHTRRVKNSVAVKRLNAELEREQSARKGAEAAAKAQNKIVKQTEKDVKAAETAIKRYNAAIASGKKSRIATVTGGDDSVNINSLNANLAASKTANDQAVTSAKTYATELERLDAVIAQLKPQFREAKTSQTALTREYTRSATALESQNAKVVKSASEVKELEGISAQAAAKIGLLATSQDEVAAASARMAAKVTAAKAQIAALSAGQTVQTVQAQPEIEGNRREVLAATFETAKAYREAQVEVKRLAAEMKNATIPSDQLAAAFGESVAKARLAKSAYKAQQAELRELGSTAQSTFAQFARQTSAPVATTASAATVNTAIASQQRLAPAIQRTATATDRAGASARTFGTGLSSLNRDTRTSLSLMQRLRGEVLAITASYLGFHAAIQQIAGSLDAFRELEAIESRLGAVFNQDTSQINQEVAFLRGEANRLGISFGTLAGQYSKFAVAAKQANFSGEATRRMFISVAEAGRVNKLSVEQLNGTFLALEQVISKGKFSAEEIRRQLGDRLPGAFSILANALGVTTAELDRVMSAGELLATESNLLKFTDELSKRFGPQLSSSLDTLSTDLGRFENSVFKSQLAVANGFVPALRIALQSFNEFANSAEGAETFAAIGDGIGTVIQLLLKVPEYFDLITFAMKVMIGVKVGSWASSMVLSLRAATGGFTSLGSAMAFIGPQSQKVTLANRVFTQSLARMVAGIDASSASIRANVAASGRMTTANRVALASFASLRGVLISVGNAARVMWAAIGGLPGVILTGIVFAISKWTTGIADASGALNEHKRQLSAVEEAYASAGASADDWRDRIDGVNEALATANLADLKSSFDDALDGVVDQLNEIDTLAQGIELSEQDGSFFNTDTLSADYKDGVRALAALKDELASGEKTATQFVDAVNDIFKSNEDERIKEFAIEMIRLASESKDGETSLVNLGQAVERQEDVLAVLEGRMASLTDETEDLAESTEEADAAFRSENLEAYSASIETLKSAIPELRSEMEALAKVTDLNKSAWNGLVAAWNNADYGAIFEIAALWGEGVTNTFNDADVAAFGGASQAASAALLKRREGFIPEAAYDVNAYRVGFGSDTTTDRFGRQSPVTENTVTTLEAANRDLARRINEFQTTIKREIGADRFNAFGIDQQAALTSIAYNYGSLQGTGRLDTFRNGTESQIVEAIKSLAPHNDGINSERRLEEAALFAQGGTTHASSELRAEAATEAQEQAEREAERAEEDRQRQAQATQDRLADGAFEIEQQRLINEGREKQAEIEAALRQAKSENANITQQELEAVANQAAQAFEARAQGEAADEAREAAKAAADERQDTADRISDTEFEISQQRLINDERGKQAAIEAAIREARESNPQITQAEIAEITRLTGLLYDQQNVVNEREKAEERINTLMSLRSSLQEQLTTYQEAGNTDAANGIKERLEGVNAQIQEVIANTIKMYEALGGPEADAAIAKLQAQALEIGNTSDQIVILGLNASQFQSLTSSFADGFTNALDNMVASIYDGEDAFDAAKNAFLQFAADFLRQMALMIIKQIALNALAAFGGPIGSAAAALGGIAGHTGGLVGGSSIGSGNPIGSGSAWGRSAFTYHSGGIAGLKPDEVSATLKRNEEILTEQDPRHRYNQGGESQSTNGRTGIKQVLAVGDDEIANAMTGSAGEDVFMTFIRRNRATIRSELG